MSLELRNSLARLSLALFLAVAAGAVGTALRPVSLAAATACEDDECERGTTCVDNPDGNTACNRSGSTCKTQGC